MRFAAFFLEYLTIRLQQICWLGWVVYPRPTLMKGKRG
jgi:hypothetical protein